MATKKTPENKTAQAGKKSQNGRKSGRSLQLAAAFWLIFIVILAGLFITRRETIRENYNILAKRFKLPTLVLSESSDGEKPDAVPFEETPPHTVTQKPAPAAPPAAAKPPANQPAAQAPAPAKQPVGASQPSAVQAPAAQPPAAQAPAVTRPPENQPAAQTPPPHVPAQPESKSVETRERGIYFTQVDNDGVIHRVKVTRNLVVSDSPMRDSLNSLLAGPTAEERRKGLMSLIPPNTKILSATVRDTTAYINFNEEFLFNTYGVEGYAAQLREVVWTATEFPTVNDVQILIEGRPIEFLGEGIWIGSPVSR